MNQKALFDVPADRKCSECGEVKPLTEFYDWKTEQRKNTCRVCIRKAMKKWRKENPDKVRKVASRSDKKCRERVNGYHRKWEEKQSSKEKKLEQHLQRNYCLSVENYDRMLSEQDGRCAICGTDKPGKDGRFCVDHCHKTGKIRGLLCRRCNMGLGFFDGLGLLERASQYLQHRG